MSISTIRAPRAPRRRPLRAVLVALALLGASSPAAATPPTFAAVRAAYCPSDLRLLDRHGEALHEQRLDLARRRLAWTPLDAVSPALTRAIVASEDRRFFAHAGVDWNAVAAALGQRLTGGAPRGASTLSMQVAALLDPDLQRGGAPRSLAAKWQQMRAAWDLERRWSKAQILEAYVNLVTFRGELQGVGAAANVLFGKAPHGLTEAEALVLAALVRSPNADRPALTRRTTLLARALRQAQGERMAEATRPGERDPLRTSESPGKRDPLRMSESPGERDPLRTSESGGERDPLRMSESSNEAPASSPSVRAERVEARGLAAAIDRVVDLPRGGGPRAALAPHAARRAFAAQGAARCADIPSTLDAELQRVAADAVRRHLLALQDRHVRDAAVLVADNASGAVRAYVAGSGDLSSARHVDGIQARRQAGSTLKPFLYGLALDRRLLTPASLLDDAPLEIAAGNGLFRPRNYDDQFRGLVSVRTALAGSLNVPAVRALLLVGADAFARQLRALGFTGVDKPGDFYGPSLALGSADVSLWQLVDAYRALANGGVWSPLHLTPAATPATPVRRVYSPAAAFVVSDILADRDSRSVTFGLESPLSTRFWSAVKTGTSKDMRDNWCIGYSRRYTVGVWVGNFSGAPMHEVSGISGAAPIWQDVMEWLQRDEASPPPAAPHGVRAMRASFTEAAEAPRREWFLADTAPDAGPAARARRPRIVAPTDGSLIAIDPDLPAARQRVAFAAADAAGARWRLDDVDLGSAAQPLLWPPRPGHHVLRLVDGARTIGQVAFHVRG